MKILSIGTDENLFKGSESRRRIAEYGSIAEELHVIVYTKGHVYRCEKIASNVFIYPTNNLLKIFFFFSAFRLGKKILNSSLISKGEWIISSQDPFETGLVGFMLKKKFNVALQIQVHTDFLNPFFRNESLKNRLRYILGRKLLHKADCIRVVSVRVKDSLMKLKYLTTRIFILPIFVDIEKIRDCPGKNDLSQTYPQYDFLVLMSSRLTREKNISIAIEAFSVILRKSPKAGLIIIGSGPERKKLISLVRKYGLESSVVFESTIGHEKLFSYYKSCDLFLLTSYYEGYGRTLVEAAAAGCKIISSDVGIASEFLPPDNIFKVGSKEDLINKIFAAVGGKTEYAPPPDGKNKKSYMREYAESMRCA